MHLEDATDKDSVAAYMERLLARSRQTTTDGEVCWLPESQDSPAALPMTGAEPQQAGGSPLKRQPDSAPTPLPGPSHHQDKATVRADLDSLRGIANSAARSAIAKYTTKSTREKILFRTLLLTIAFVLAAVLLTSSMWGAGKYVNLGWCAVAACGALGIDILLRTSSLRTRRSKAAAPSKRAVEDGEPETAKTLR